MGEIRDELDPIQQESYNLLDLLNHCVKWRFLITLSVLGVAIVTAIISFLVTPRFRSIAVVKPTQTSESGLGGFIASKLASMGGFGGFAPSLGELPGELLVVVLRSREMSEKVLAHFDLRNVYGLEDQPTEAVIDFLRARTDFELDFNSQTVRITVEDNDAARAKQIADFYVSELDRKNQEMKSSRARKEREFVHHRLVEEESKLAEIEDSAAGLQASTGVVDVEEQLKSSVRASADLQAKRIMVQSQLELYQKIFREDDPSVQYMVLQLEALDSALSELVRHRDSAQAPDLLMRLSDIPTAGLASLRLMRELEIHQLLVGYLTQAYEQSRIEEFRNTPTLSVIDPPSLATFRIWPRRGLMVGIAALTSLVFAVFVTAWLEFWRTASADTGHPQHLRVVRLRSVFRRY